MIEIYVFHQKNIAITSKIFICVFKNTITSKICMSLIVDSLRNCSLKNSHITVAITLFILPSTLNGNLRTWFYSCLLQGSEEMKPINN